MCPVKKSQYQLHQVTLRTGFVDTSNPVVTPWSFMVNFYRITIAGLQMGHFCRVHFLWWHMGHRCQMRVRRPQRNFQKASRFDSLADGTFTLQQSDPLGGQTGTSGVPKSMLFSRGRFDGFNIVPDGWLWLNIVEAHIVAWKTAGDCAICDPLIN